jgi:tetratricopeptide (TPR) repeat protein
MYKWITELHDWPKQRWGHLAILLAAALVFTHSSTSGSLLNYDDERYIQGNALIATEDGIQFRRIFTEYFDGHYHPLTLLSLACDNALADDSIRMHHQTNWLLHLLNALLIYLLFGSLFPEKWSLAFGATLLFELHPMNVESYAWMTERKNVQYTFFFLLSALQYVGYVRTQDPKRLLWSYFFLIASLLSKAQAVVLLPVFLVIDTVERRNLRKWSIWLEKIPALLLFSIFLFITRDAQEEAWGDLNSSVHSLTDRLLLSTSALGAYLLKGLVPLELSPYYPYPEHIGESLGSWHFAGPLWLICLIGALYFSWKRNNKMVLWGLAFFFLNIILMIKFFDVPYGDYYMANRYLYLPSAGLAWLMLLLIVPLCKKFIAQTNLATYLPIATLAILFGSKTQEQLAVWNNSEALWTEVTDRFPTYPHAQNMLAISQLQAGKTKEAEQSMLQLIELDPSFIGGHENLAALYFQRKMQQKALYHAELALKERGGRAATLEMAIEIFRSYGQFDRALECLSILILLDPENTAHLLTRARILNELDREEELIRMLEGREEPEVQKFLRQIEKENRKKDPDMLRAQKLLDRGMQMGKSGQLNEAHQLFSRSIEIDPTNAVAYINRGSNLAQMGEFEKALKDLLKAKQINPNQAMAYYLLAAVYRDLGQAGEACRNKIIAESKGMTLPKDFDRYCKARSH